MDLTALEESLKKLEAELKAKEEKLGSFEHKFDKEPGTFVSRSPAATRPRARASPG